MEQARASFNRRYWSPTLLHLFDVVDGEAGEEVNDVACRPNQVFAMSLRHPVLDADRGFLLAPMNAGIRLTTGAEFASRDAPRTPVQLARAEPVARGL